MRYLMMVAVAAMFCMTSDGLAQCANGGCNNGTGAVYQQAPMATYGVAAGSCDTGGCETGGCGYGGGWGHAGCRPRCGFRSHIGTNPCDFPSQLWAGFAPSHILYSPGHGGCGSHGCGLLSRLHGVAATRCHSVGGGFCGDPCAPCGPCGWDGFGCADGCGGCGLLSRAAGHIHGALSQLRCHGGCGWDACSSGCDPCASACSSGCGTVGAGCGFGHGCGRYRVGLLARMAESHRSWLSNCWMSCGGALDPCGLVRGFPASPLNLSFSQYDFGCSGGCSSGGCASGGGCAANSATAMPQVVSTQQVAPQMQVQGAQPVATSSCVQNMPAGAYNQQVVSDQPINGATHQASPASSGGNTFYQDNNHDVSLPQSPQADPMGVDDLPNPEAVDESLEKINI